MLQARSALARLLPASGAWPATGAPPRSPEARTAQRRQPSGRQTLSRMCQLCRIERCHGRPCPLQPSSAAVACQRALGRLQRRQRAGVNSAANPGSLAIRAACSAAAGTYRLLLLRVCRRKRRPPPVAWARARAAAATATTLRQARQQQRAQLVPRRAALHSKPQPARRATNKVRKVRRRQHTARRCRCVAGFMSALLLPLPPQLARSQA